MDTKDPQTDESKMSTKQFVRWYNDNVPEDFPKSSVESMDDFKKKHHGLFRGRRKWQIDRHRKHVMNWLFIRKSLEAISSN
ncbi:MAG: hypothetical protein NTZ10_00220 [Candidatus Saganbacteria bacterium]|nr:hypothetical protein [Candidatus Saganbacteria bacterium]